MSRLPIFPTLVVAAAIAAMIRLGIWQLHRADEKEALRIRYAQNSRLAVMALPVGAPADARLIFRRAGALCLKVTGWEERGGRSAGGMPGTRFLARCATGAQGPAFLVDMGVSADPRFRPGWTGGNVVGRIVSEPSRAGLVDRILRRGPVPPAMLIADRAAPGLQPSAQPAPADMPNNSWSYAMQWFFFAAAAAVIYALALRGRRRKGGPAPR
jgi:surfeit locus 1 family protein